MPCVVVMGPLFVTRRNTGNVVLKSKQDYEGLLEILHLLKSPANGSRLMLSIEQANRGRTQRGLFERAALPP